MNIFIRVVLFFYLLTNVFIGWGQTNPMPQGLPYAQGFSTLDHSSSAYPPGWQGWNISTRPGESFSVGPPTADRPLEAGSTASTASGNVHNFDGKIGYLNTGSLDQTVVLAISTLGKENVEVTYEIMTIRNPYNGGSNTRINEVILQYRVGMSGDFISLVGTEYQNNIALQNSGTDPQNPEQKTIVLPGACDNQIVVQIRWASREVSGGGSRPSFAVDNIFVDGDDAASIPPSLMAGPTPLPGFSYISGEGPSGSRVFTVSGAGLDPKTGSVAVSGSAHFEVSVDNVEFSDNLLINYSGGAFGPTNMYVRLKAGLAEGKYSNDEIVISDGGAADAIVAISGSVMEPVFLLYTFKGESVNPTQMPASATTSDFQISSGSVNFGTTGTWSGSGTPYAQGNTGWGADDSQDAKYFFFSVEPIHGKAIDLSNISFEWLVTGAGPSAIDVEINGITIATFDSMGGTSDRFSEDVSAFIGLTHVAIKIKGWDNGSRSTSGGGAFRINDVRIDGEIYDLAEPVEPVAIPLANWSLVLLMAGMLGVMLPVDLSFSGKPK
jgi:hypothetical protein